MHAPRAVGWGGRQHTSPSHRVLSLTFDVSARFREVCQRTCCGEKGVQVIDEAFVSPVARPISRLFRRIRPHLRHFIRLSVSAHLRTRAHVSVGGEVVWSWKRLGRWNKEKTTGQRLSPSATLPSRPAILIERVEKRRACVPAVVSPPNYSPPTAHIHMHVHVFCCRLSLFACTRPL